MANKLENLAKYSYTTVVHGILIDIIDLNLLYLPPRLIVHE